MKKVVKDLTSGGIDWQREKWQSGLGSKFIHQGEKNAVKYADEVIVLSKGVQDYFKETYGRKTHFIPNGVNRPQTREANLITDKFGLKKDSYILFLGRLVPEKGIRYLVEAFKNADMNSGRVMNLRVTIPAESRRMNVGKDVIRILGSPAYICVLQRKDRKSIAITPCAAEHPMSFKVPDRLLTDGQCRMMINGIQFIQALLEANGLAAGKDHQFKGRYDAEKNAVIISLKNGEYINLQKRTQQNSTRYRTALYLRLSREDGDKTESDSIANQRTLLEAYAADHPELCIVDEFVDDGYSGSNFERPAFQNLFRELEQGTINCVLVKDLSRFGRNYIEVGRYLERIFPVMRVRLIAVTDNYDSQSAWKTSDSIMIPMRNLLNDAYCRDISVKIKSQLAVKRKRGDFVGSFATYSSTSGRLGIGQQESPDDPFV